MTVKKMPVTGYGYALDPLRSVGVDKKNEGQGVIPRPFMCVGSFACLTAGASGGRERLGWLWLRRQADGWLPAVSGISPAA